jgi:hypothetical protein
MRPDLEDKVLRTLGRPPHLRAVASEVLVGLPTRGCRCLYLPACLYDGLPIYCGWSCNLSGS